MATAVGTSAANQLPPEIRKGFFAIRAKRGPEKARLWLLATLSKRGIKKAGSKQAAGAKPAKKIGPYDDPTGENLMGKIVSSDRLGKVGTKEGIQQSYRVTLENGMQAVWKPLDGELKDARPSQISTGTAWRREGVGYQVARLVGMENMVPPSRVRQVDGKWGSIQAWIPDAELDGTPSGANALRSIEMMTVFDSLMYNTDRHGRNWLTTKDGRLHAIDNGLTLPVREFPSSTRQEMVAGWKELVPRSILKKWESARPRIVAEMRRHGIEDEAIRRFEARLDFALKTPKLRFADMLRYVPDDATPKERADSKFYWKKFERAAIRAGIATSPAST